ncbi:hypothetical protein DAEQUDRAFT_742728 [Daedalea quercina L-15889]|uniref:Uncharacterized protein n=1 Tax=Daedalea quercina L-15889 TaxID=1314783 RepID=A0A165TVR7_9APHY|nr:hypothetical protein DAEQUDRAFT_742728 [Daedalea quercina L-15889]
MSPPADLKEVVDSEIRHILSRNADEHQAALELRDAVLRWRRDGAFIAVPLFRVNTDPTGLHPVGSYENWCPSESFASVYSYLCLNRGNLSVLVHPLTREEMGPSFPLDLTTLRVLADEIPLQCPSLSYSSDAPILSLEDRRKIGVNIERILKGEKEAAKAPSD